MPALSTRTIRLRVDSASSSNFIEEVTGKTPFQWRADALRMDVGIFYGISGTVPVDAEVLDIVGSDIQSLTVEVRSSARSTVNLMAQTVSSFTNTLTAATWLDGSNQHAVFNFTDAECNILPGDYVMSISCIRGSGAIDTLGVTAFTIHNTAAGGSAANPAVNPGSAISLAEADARYLGASAADSLFDYDPNTPSGSPLNNVYRIRHSFDNFLANSSFEFWYAGTSVAPDAWTASGDMTVSRRSTASIGNYSAQVVFGTANTGELYQVIASSTLVDYTYSVYVQRTAGTGTARLVAQDAGSPYTEFASVTLPTTAGWSLITLTVKPSTGTQLRFSIKSGNTVASTWLIDEAMMQESLGVASAWLPANINDTYAQNIYANKTFLGGLTTSTIFNTGTLTLPTSTDTLVGKSTTDILSNKTFNQPLVKPSTAGEWAEIEFQVPSGGRRGRVRLEDAAVATDNPNGEWRALTFSVNADSSARSEVADDGAFSMPQLQMEAHYMGAPVATVTSSTAANPTTVTHSGSTLIYAGMGVEILGHSVSSLNGRWTVASVADSTHFTVAALGGGTGGNIHTPADEINYTQRGVRQINANYDAVNGRTGTFGFSTPLSVTIPSNFVYAGQSDFRVDGYRPSGEGTELLLRNTHATNARTHIRFSNSLSGHNFYIGNDRSSTGATGDNLFFYDSTTNAEMTWVGGRLILGNILTDDATNKLQVPGNAKITGALEVTGNFTLGGTVVNPLTVVDTSSGHAIQGTSNNSAGEFYRTGMTNGSGGQPIVTIGGSPSGSPTSFQTIFTLGGDFGVSNPTTANIYVANSLALYIKTGSAYYRFGADYFDCGSSKMYMGSFETAAGASIVNGTLSVTGGITANLTGTATTVTTNANLTGEVTSSGNAATLTNSAVIGKVLTGFTSGAGVVSSSDTILSAIQKINGNVIAAGAGTVTTVSVTTANGVSGSVATASTTPAITLTLGAITPSSIVASGTISGSNLSGTNTGDQTTVSGNAGSATVLATARAINGVNFDGSAAITVTAAAGTLSGATLNSTVTASSLTSFGASIALGTPASGVATNLTGLPLTTGVTGTLPVLNGGTGVTTSTGSGANVLATSPTLVTPALGTPASGVATNLTGTASGLTAGNVTTNANLTGEVTSSGNAATLTNSAVIGKVLTGFTSGAGTVASTDTILGAIQKLNGNIAAVSGGADSIDTLTNLTLAASRSGSAETFALKTKAGTDPAAGDVGMINFRDSASTTGGYVARSLTAAISLTIPSTAHLGTKLSGTITVTIAAPGVVTYTGHGMRPGDSFVFSTTGALPTGITAGTTYFVSAVVGAVNVGYSADTFQFSATAGGASITTTGSQSGVHTITQVPQPFRLWLVAADDAATVRLGVIRCDLGSGSIFPLRDGTICSSTAISSSSNSSGVIYSGTAWTSKAIRVLGYFDYTLAVAGTWGTAPTLIQPRSSAMNFPGEVVQASRTNPEGLVTTTALIAAGYAVPVSSEGAQFLSTTITPTAAANRLRCRHLGQYYSTAQYAVVALFRDSELTAIRAMFNLSAYAVYALDMNILAGTTAAQTLKIRAGSSGASTLYMSSNIGAALWGGKTSCYLEVEEIMT